MKILQINTVCGTGSTGRIVTDIHTALKNNDISSTVMYGRGNANLCNDAIKISNKIDFYYHALKTRAFDAHGFSSSILTRRALRLVDELQPDIIHLHNIHGYYLNVELLFSYLKKKTKIKVIWTLHDCWPFTGHCAYFDFVECDKWKKQCLHCPQKKSYPASNIFDNSFVNYQRKKIAFSDVKDLTIVTPSSWLASLVKKSYLKNYPVKVINNGIDLTIFKYRSSNFRSLYNIVDKFIIMGAASTWSPRKGFSDFIKLANRLPSVYQIVMVGLSMDMIKKLPDNIIGIHRTDNPTALAEIYSAADVFFNPTYEDNYPTVNLEAIACGTPVITYNTGGSPESVSENYGFVIEKGDILSAIKIIEELKKKPMVLGTTPTSFNKDVFVDSMLKLYL